MSKFINVLKLSPYADGINWCVIEDFIFEYGEEGKGIIITVPKGFITDFASVPHVFWNILPPWGKYGPAAVVHDWLYYDQSTTKDFADDVLMEGMKVMQTEVLQRDIIYEAVHKAGQDAWNENAKKKKLGFIRVAQDVPSKMSDTSFYWTGSTGDWKKG